MKLVTCYKIFLPQSAHLLWLCSLIIILNCCSGKKDDPENDPETGSYIKFKADGKDYNITDPLHSGNLGSNLGSDIPSSDGLYSFHSGGLTNPGPFPSWAIGMGHNEKFEVKEYKVKGYSVYPYGTMEFIRIDQFADTTQTYEYELFTIKITSITKNRLKGNFSSDENDPELPKITDGEFSIIRSDQQ